MSEEAVDPNYVDTAIAAVEADTEAEQELSPDHPNMADDLGELPETSFFGGSEEKAEDTESAPDESQSLETDPKVVEDASNATVLNYRAEGKDFEVDFNTDAGRDRIRRALSLEKGARRHMSESGKLRQQLKKSQARLKENSKYKEVWDKLEGIKDDPATLYEAISGEPLKDFIARETTKRKKYDDASDDERKMLDYQDEVGQMQRREAKREADHKTRMEEFDSKQRGIEKDTHYNTLTPIFEKYADFTGMGLNAGAANGLRETLWTSALSKLDSLSDQYNVDDPRVIEAVFQNRAKLLRGTPVKLAEQQVDKMVEEKKAKAKSQAQIASSTNYPGRDIAKDVNFKDPVDLFNSWFGK